MTDAARINWTKTPMELGEAAMKYGRGIGGDALPRYARRKARELESRMRQEAPWTDQTGEARKKLKAEVETEPTKTTIYLITGAAHGKYLELRWGGRYAVVSPTIPRAAIEIAGELRAGMGR